VKTLAALLLLASPAAADEIHLSSGAVHEGKVTDLGDSYRVTRAGSSAVYPKFMVKDVVFKKTDEETYAERTRQIKEDDAEARLALARWCLERKLPALAQAEYRRIISANPDHEEARAALGHRRHNDKWMSEDEINASKGLVKHNGRWVTPEERDLDVALEENKELDRQITAKVKGLIDRLRSQDEKRRADAVAELARIEDKYKTRPFLTGVTSSSRFLRRHAIDELGRIREPAAARPIARRAVFDEDEEVREAARRALEAIGHPDTALFLIPFLSDSSTRARIRAENALGATRDPRAVPALAEALENARATLDFLASYSQEQTYLVNRVLVLKNGQKVLLPKIVKVTPESLDPEQKSRLEEEKAAILGALRAIAGEDLGDDPARWREWAQKKK
jgi:hypothetical protein